MKGFIIVAAGVLATCATSTAYSNPDYQCLADCGRRYSRAYCLQVCEVHAPQPQVRTADPFGAFLEGRRARQESDAREAELERMRADAAKTEAETQRIYEQIARDAAEAKEKARLEAENEALKQRLKELEVEKPAAQPEPSSKD